MTAGNTGPEQRAGYVLGLLTAAHLLGYVDRFIFALLVEPIKSDLHLSDFQIGLLLGPALSIPLVFAGLGCGWLADRVRRQQLLAVGIFAWSLFTAATCLASSFGSLLAMRIGVGIGEAVLYPCCYSMLADLYPRRRRSMAISIFMTGTFAGAGTAFLMGGALMQKISRFSPVVLPVWGRLADWQAAFLFVGAPGLLVGLLMLLTVGEPARTELMEIAGEGRAQAGYGKAIGHVLGRWKSYATLSAGAIGIMAVGSGIQWTAAIFSRSWGWSLADMSRATGLMFFVAGPLGTAFGIWLVTRWQHRAQVDAPARGLLLGLSILVLSFIALSLAPSAGLALAALFFALFGQAIGTAAGPTAMLQITPGNFRAQVAALYSLTNNLVSQFVGTPLVGWLADRFGHEHGLSQALFANSLITGSIVVLAVGLGLRHYRRSAEEVARAIA